MLQYAHIDLFYNYYIIMQQVQQKADQFHKQIRQRQHNQIFKKLRHAYSNPHNNSCHSNNTNTILSGQHRKVLQQLFDTLPNMYQLAHNIQSIVDNQSKILQYIQKIRQYQDNQMVVAQGWQLYDSITLRNRDTDALQKGVYVPLIQYMLHVSTCINKHINNIDIEQGNNYQQQQQKQKAFSTLLLPISFFLINFSSIDNATNYIHILSQFTVYRSHIDIFHNLFLMQLPLDIKQMLILRYLQHLSNSPRFCLNNCHIFSKTLSYAVLQQPHLNNRNNSKHHNIMVRIVQAIQKLNSIIALIDTPDKHNTQIQIKQNISQYKLHSAQILQQITIKNQSICLEVARSTYTMTRIQRVLGQLKMYCSVAGKMVDDQYKFDQINSTIGLVNNMTYWDNVQQWVLQCKPTIIMSLTTIYQKLAMQQWIIPQHSSSSFSSKSQPVIPPMLANPCFKSTLVPRILKCLTNIISLDQHCQYFTNRIFYLNHQNHVSVCWVEILNIIYNQNYKCMEVRIECLMLFSNALLGSAKCYLNNTRQQYEQQYIIQHKQYDKPKQLIHILDYCIDLVMQVLKLTNSHNKIITSVLKTLLTLIQQGGNKIRKIELFSDHSFKNRLAAIAESNNNTIHENIRNDYYDQSVRLQAQYLLEAIAIQLQ